MGNNFPHTLLEDPKELAKLKEWSEEVYQDFQAYEQNQLSEEGFAEKYRQNVAILVLDMTGFTKDAMRYGSLHSLLRIFHVQKVCVPVFQEYQAKLIKAFADDLTVLFDDPGQAVDAALEAHRRVTLYNQSEHALKHPASTCIGIGFGETFALGPNLAMGDEMNRASKLGEDTAERNEILITENVHEAIKHRKDLSFELSKNPDIPFTYYLVSNSG